MYVLLENWKYLLKNSAFWEFSTHVNPKILLSNWRNGLFLLSLADFKVSGRL